MDPREGQEKEIAQLAGPRMPADHGLASLGLIMQLGGSIFLGYMAMLAVFPTFAGFASGSFVIFLIGTAGAVRSAFHRTAGSALVYGSPRGVFVPCYTYVGVAVAQTALTLLIINKDGGVPAQLNATIALVLLAWPLTLLVALTRPRLKGLASETLLPVSEDMGFEGSAALMVLLGLIGSLVALFMLYTAFKLPSGALGSPQALLLIGVFAMLLARSILHTIAGVKGTRGIDSDGATESAARYFTFGVVSSVIAGGALLLLLMMGGGPGAGMHPVMLLFMAVVVYLLLSWPLILRRFYTERNFTALLEGAQGPSYRRVPDAGMTAVGWLLIALGVLQLSLTLPAALTGHADFVRSLYSLGGLDGGDMEMAAARSPWWSVGTGLAQLWAGLELIHMTDRHRVAATIYGAAAALVTIYVMWPQLQQLDRMAFSGMEGFGSVASYFQIAVSLVVPIGTMVLANRQLVPTAQARVTSRPAGGGGTSAL